VSINSNVSDEAALSVASGKSQHQKFRVARVVSTLFGLGLVAWGLRRRRSWIGRSVGTLGASLVVRSLGDGPLAMRLTTFINTRARFAGFLQDRAPDIS
jgi:hypothetical protein